MVGEADDLEKEVDHGNFFAAYSLVNNSLEEMFIDLLLLMDESQADTKMEEKCMVDFSEVLEALKAVTLKKRNGKCNGIGGAEVSQQLDIKISLSESIKSCCLR